MNSTITAAPGSALERLEQEGGPLDQLSSSEGGVPRIKINNKLTQFEDTITGLTVPQFTGVICGIVKQRLLWPPEMSEDKSDPLCRSVDFEIGYPNPDTFPLKESKLELPGDVVTANTTVACEDCHLKEFNTNPKGGSGPWCGEQIQIILMADMDESGTLMPSIFTVQRSGLKASRSYLAGFKRAQIQPFSHYTKFSLNPQSRGNVDYSVPVFKRMDSIDASEHEPFAATFFAMKDYLMAVRTIEDPNAPKKASSEGKEDLPEF